jgi:hypothetical protein
MTSQTRKASVQYNPFTGCPKGYKKRGAYTHKSSGRRISALCISKKGSHKLPASRSLSRPRAADAAAAVAQKTCPTGYVLRKGYVRKFRQSIRRKGYSVHRKNGRTYRIFPKTSNEVEVKAACVKVTEQADAAAAADLKRGQLRKHGYQYRLSDEFRRAALKKAVQEYTPTGVYKILNTATKLARKEKPLAAKIFEADRDWLRSEYGITGSLLRD